jgi:hypothetical protein
MLNTFKRDELSPDLTILCAEEPSASDANIENLGQFMGIHARTLPITDTSRVLPSVERSSCTICSANTVSHLWQTPGGGQRAWGRILDHTRLLFIYGFDRSGPGPRIAAQVTASQIRDVLPLVRTDHRYGVSFSQPEITGVFSGLSFGQAQRESDFTFVNDGTQTQRSTLITIDGLPFFISFQRGRSTIFLLACREVLDLAQKMSRTVSVNDTFSRLLPVAMFLRFAVGKKGWHSERALANFIIDDPLLTPSYGFLNYRDLAAKLNEANCAASIAFIPWNHKRTDAAVARLFREHREQLSLCVHGCDHTRAEFADTDYALLNAKVRLASQRMQLHEKLTGIPCSEVMVFPQGQFSIESLKVLQANNYLASVNSGPLPANRDQRDQLTVEDFLHPAITKYAGVPLFLRRYPERIEQCAFDLFWGKPLLFVEHHSYFRDNCAKFISFIARLNSLSGDLQWCSLSEAVSKAHRERDISADETLFRMYASTQLVENHRPAERTFLLLKSYPANEVEVDQVLVNGHASTFTIRRNCVELVVRVPAKSSVTVKVVHNNHFPSGACRRTFAEKSHIWTRRMLSEIRDNILLPRRISA